MGRCLAITDLGTQHPLSELCSRRFLRLVMAYVSLDTFLSQIIPRLIYTLLNPTVNFPHLPSINMASSSPTEKEVLPDSNGNEEQSEIEDVHQVVGSGQPDAYKPIVPAVQPTSLSTFVDEIGLDLRTIDTEDELLDLIVDPQKWMAYSRSPSAHSSNRTSALSQDSAVVQFSLNNESENDPST